MKYISANKVQEMLNKVLDRTHRLDERFEENNGFGYDLGDDVDPNGDGYTSCRDQLDAQRDILLDLLEMAVELEPMKQIVQEIKYGNDKYVWIEGHYELVKVEPERRTK